MYEATKVPGVWEHVPDKLRGIFWMKGNALGEELTVLQYGRYFESEKLYIIPWVPFIWAWAGGTPEDAPLGGALYEKGDDWGNAYSFKFEPCPEGRSCMPGSEDFSYAVLQPHNRGDLREVSQGLEALVPENRSLNLGIATFEMEEMMDGPQPGSKYLRRIHWGFGSCQPYDFGSYTLVKVLSGDGEPVQPYYDEFVDYMGSVPLFIWSGWLEGFSGW